MLLPKQKRILCGNEAITLDSFWPTVRAEGACVALLEAIKEKVENTDLLVAPSSDLLQDTNVLVCK